MSLHDAVAAELPYLREQAEGLMVDSCTIQRPTGLSALDPVTLDQVPTFTPVWAGPCRVQRSATVTPNDRVTGAFEFGVSLVIVQAPMSARGVHLDDVVTITAVGPESDPELVGSVFTVGADLTKTHATKRSLICAEVT